jgi:integrase
MTTPSVHARVSGHVKRIRRKRGFVFYVRYRLASGKLVQKLLGQEWTERGRPPEGFYTRKMAEIALQAILADARRGLLPDPDRHGGGPTFVDAATEYLRYVGEVRRIDPQTVKDYRGVIEGYLKDEFGQLELEAITPDLIDAYKEKLIAAGKLSNRTIVRHLTVLHGIFKRAKRKWGLRDNPASADLVERPKVVYTGEFDTFDPDEIERLAAAAGSDQDAALYKVAAFTGLRTGELFALRWEHVDFVDGLLHVRRNYTGGVEKVPKGKRVRSVPMMPQVIDTLAQLKGREHFTEDGDLVFCSTVGEHLDYFDHLDRYHAALHRAGLRRLRFHDLRHAFGSAAITKLDPYAVQSYMGHQHYSTTQRYLHHKPRREDAARLADAFRVHGDAVATAEHAVADRVPNGVPNGDTSTATERNSEHRIVPETPEQAGT